MMIHWKDQEEDNLALVDTALATTQTLGQALGVIRDSSVRAISLALSSNNGSENGRAESTACHKALQTISIYIQGDIDDATRACEALLSQESKAGKQQSRIRKVLVHFLVNEATALHTVRGITHILTHSEKDVKLAAIRTIKTWFGREVEENLRNIGLNSTLSLSNGLLECTKSESIQATTKGPTRLTVEAYDTCLVVLMSLLRFALPTTKDLWNQFARLLMVGCNWYYSLYSASINLLSFIFRDDTKHTPGFIQTICDCERAFRSSLASIQVQKELIQAVKSGKVTEFEKAILITIILGRNKPAQIGSTMVTLGVKLENLFATLNKLEEHDNSEMERLRQNLFLTFIQCVFKSGCDKDNELLTDWAIVYLSKESNYVKLSEMAHTIIQENLQGQQNKRKYISRLVSSLLESPPNFDNLRALCALDTLMTVSTFIQELNSTQDLEKVRNVGSMLVDILNHHAKDIPSVIMLLLGHAMGKKDSVLLSPADVTLTQEDLPQSDVEKRMEKIMQVFERWAETDQLGKLWVTVILPFLLEKMASHPKEEIYVKLAAKLGPRLGSPKYVSFVVCSCLQILGTQQVVLLNKSLSGSQEQDEDAVFQRLSPLLLLRVLPFSAFSANELTTTTDIAPLVGEPLFQFPCLSKTIDNLISNTRYQHCVPVTIENALASALVIRCFSDYGLSQERKVAGELLARIRLDVTIQPLLKLLGAQIKDTFKPLNATRTVFVIYTSLRMHAHTNTQICIPFAKDIVHALLELAEFLESKGPPKTKELVHLLHGCGDTIKFLKTCVDEETQGSRHQWTKVMDNFARLQQKYS
eukprot:m.175104 g.175104  ORF g.175104 m.175104 type:complete len:815 (+) comp15418_c0_seq4:385-2829(+)